MLEIITLDEPRVVIGGVAIFIAGLVRGFAGFGSGMIMIAVLMALYPPATALPVVLLTELVLSLVLLPTAWFDIKWTSIWPMVLAAAITSPAGVMVLSVLNEEVARVMVSVLILSFVIKLQLQRSLNEKPSTANAMRAGGLSGFMGGIAGMTGPPVVAFFLRLSLAPREIRATMIGYFVIVDAWLLWSFAWQTQVNSVHANLAFLALIPLVIGSFVGSLLFPLATPKIYRRIALTAISVAALVSPVI